jgi:hypothetical protein
MPVQRPMSPYARCGHRAALPFGCNGSKPVSQFGAPMSPYARCGHGRSEELAGRDTQFRLGSILGNGNQPTSSSRRSNRRQPVHYKLLLLRSRHAPDASS